MALPESRGYYILRVDPLTQNMKPTHCRNNCQAFHHPIQLSAWGCRINAALGSNFATTALLTTVTLASSQLARLIVAVECWHPRHVTNVCSIGATDS